MKSSFFINTFLLVCFSAVSICIDDFPGWVPDFPSGACYAEGLACEIHNDNLVQSVPAVATVDECRQLCFEDHNCSHFSYFSNNSFPMTNFCFLVSDCSTLHQCEECFTEDRFCFTTCGDNVEGTIGDNIVELMVDVTDELDCKLNCINNTDCKFYTYHNGSDPSYPEICFLLTEVKEPILTCQHCSTGPARCDNKENICGFRDNGSLSEAMMFTETSTTYQVETISVGMCEVAIFGIGGGGKGGESTKYGEYGEFGEYGEYGEYEYGEYEYEYGEYEYEYGEYGESTKYGGGGGSGHPSFASFFPHRSSKLLVDVGKDGHSSSVTGEDGLLVMVALAGEDGKSGSFDGATGYSGGGGDGYKTVGTGGTNGGDGVTGSEGHGGKGSGIDISKFGMKKFALSPGAGGDHMCGGGGGGILINGKGPDTYKPGMGMGYGGGGEGCKKQILYGSPGAVLMEIKK